MQGQGVIWLKLYCLNPSFLALIAEVIENWMQRLRESLRNKLEMNNSYIIVIPLRTI